jgi:hypothetical protein
MDPLMQRFAINVFFGITATCLLSFTLTGCGIIAQSPPKTYRHASNFEETQLQSTIDTGRPVVPDIYLFAQMLAERNAVLAGKERNSDPSTEEHNTHHKQGSSSE